MLENFTICEVDWKTVTPEMRADVEDGLSKQQQKQQQQMTTTISFIFYCFRIIHLIRSLQLCDHFEWKVFVKHSKRKVEYPWQGITTWSFYLIESRSFTQTTLLAINVIVFNTLSSYIWASIMYSLSNWTWFMTQNGYRLI